MSFHILHLRNRWLIAPNEAPTLDDDLAEIKHPGCGHRNEEKRLKGRFEGGRAGAHNAIAI